MMPQIDSSSAVATAEVWIAIAETFVGAVALASFFFGISRFLVAEEEGITEYSTNMSSNR